MSQHGLDRMDVRTTPNQMGSKGMAQGMGGYVRLDAGLFPVVLDDFPEPLTAHGLSAAIGEQPLGLLPLKQLIAALFQIHAQSLLGRFAKGNHTHLLAVPACDVSHLHVQVRKLQPD